MSMTPSHAVSTYQTVEVTSRSPVELIVMLYDAALAAMVEAQEALASGDQRAKAPALAKALSIVHALQSSLDMQGGGEVATRLDAVYDYVSERLVEANIRRDPAPLSETIGIFTTIRDAWARISVAPTLPAG